ncbi:endonuclease [Cellulophaga lytica]|uniref:DNA/RNA non-specific endonuclease n=1 Tax=Cellulophaga lytica TaxID=979 RepID=UPI0004F7680C|nr:DNA/RNA non-specific endonuclease [Cellulophaga lytica]AIM59666.1 endonuclease [Cellulophaga lytica]
MTKKTTYLILMVICTVGFWLFNNFYTPDTYTDASVVKDNKQVKLENYLQPSSTTGVVVKHNYFTLSYNEKYEQAEWVAYLLNKQHLTYEDRKRPYFIEDPKVKTKSADWRNYKRSGYDRGHLCPAGDRRFALQAYNETFYTSNITPQKNDFNAGVWNRLEKKVRQWVKRDKELYVVTGGVLKGRMDEIGDEDVAVPNYFYKIVAKGKGDNLNVIAFLFPHKESKKELSSFVVSVDKIEKETGIDFFEALPKQTQDKLEAKVNVTNWAL